MSNILCLCTKLQAQKPSETVMVFANGGNCPCSGLPPAGRLGRLGLGSWDDEINDEIFMSLG